MIETFKGYFLSQQYNNSSGITINQRCSFVKADKDVSNLAYGSSNDIGSPHYYERYQYINSTMTISPPMLVNKEDGAYSYCNVLKKYNFHVFCLCNSPNGQLYISFSPYDNQLILSTGYFDIVKTKDIYIILSIILNQKTIEGRVLTAQGDNLDDIPTIKSRTTYILFNTPNSLIKTGFGLAKLTDTTFIYSVMVSPYDLKKGYIRRLILEEE